MHTEADLTMGLGQAFCQLANRAAASEPPYLCYVSSDEGVQHNRLLLDENGLDGTTYIVAILTVNRVQRIQESHLPPVSRSAIFAWRREGFVTRSASTY